MVTCYDYAQASTISKTPIDSVLVGDSVAMTVHGHPNTVLATMDMMVLHTAAVARGLKQQFLIVDLPFLGYRISRSNTMRNVQQLFQAGAQAVKLEGGDDYIYSMIEHLVTAGIPVMGHIGLTPQYVHQFGGYFTQGKSKEQAELLSHQAQRLEQAGVFALVLECIPRTLAKTITTQLHIPTIGIGAGPDTDGQILVWHDFLGLQTSFQPRFIKQFAQAEQVFLDGIKAYINEVQTGVFPSDEHVY